MEYKGYLSTVGLTSTSANHIANLAKEQIRILKADLDALNLVERREQLISGTLDIVTKSPYQPDIKTNLLKIAKYTVLISWLREALKYKKELVANKENERFSCNLESPSFPTKESEVEYETTAENYSKIKAETYAVVYGQYLNPEGKIHRARVRALDALSEPNSTHGEGRDRIVVKYKVIDFDIFEEVYESLLKDYRNFNKEVNSRAFEGEKALREDYQKKLSEYQSAHEKYVAEYSKLRTEWEAKHEQELEALADLKIVVPEDLKPLIAELQG